MIMYAGLQNTAGERIKTFDHRLRFDFGISSESSFTNFWNKFVQRPHEPVWGALRSEGEIGSIESYFC